jgi:hypothetical protein
MQVNIKILSKGLLHMVLFYNFVQLKLPIQPQVCIIHATFQVCSLIYYQIILVKNDLLLILF